MPPPRCAPGHSVLDVNYSPARTDFFTTKGIEGAQPLVKYMRWKQRTSTFLTNDQVHGAQPRQTKLFKDRRNPLDVHDINNDPDGAGHVFKVGSRCVNVLNPRYVWDVPKGLTGQWDLGEVEGAKPLPNMNARDAPKALHNKQMPAKETVWGSTSKGLHELQLGKAVSGFTYLEQARSEVRNTNHIADIDGTAADSFCHFRTNRVVDPLRPEYTWPGLSADIGSAAFCHTPDRVPTPPLTSTPGAPLPEGGFAERTPTPAPPSPAKDSQILAESLRQATHLESFFLSFFLLTSRLNVDDPRS